MNAIAIAVDNTTSETSMETHIAETTTPSYADLQSRAAELRAQADALDAQMEAAKDREIEELAIDVEVMIADAGLDVDDVLRRMRPQLFELTERPVKQARKKAADGAAVVRRQRTVWRDAEGREYKGGRIPAWLKNKMDAIGSTEVKAYCEQYMTKAVA